MQYYRPTDIGEALIWLKSHADDGAIVAAGCTDLFPATGRPRLDGPVLDVTAIGALHGITQENDGWRFGAATTWADLISHPLPPAFDGLKLAAREVGSVQIQNSATLAGNLCNASPAADGAPCWLTLDASVELQSASGIRQMPLGEFLLGPRKTALAADEILTAIVVPSQSTIGRSTFVKLGARKFLVISIAMVAARISATEGIIDHAAIAVGACSAVATRLNDLERVLLGRPLSRNTADTINADLMATSLSPIDDVRGDADYRIAAATELVRRSVCALAEGEA